MLRRLSLVAVLVIVLVSAVELLWDLTPLEQLTGVLGQAGRGEQVGEAAATVIRIGIAAWQMDEFPWEETIRRYEQAHAGKVRIRHSVLPEGSLNSILLLWALQGRTRYDVVVAWADEEIHPFIDYNWNTTDPARRSLIINVRDYLAPEQLDAFAPALFGGCSRKDPQTGQTNLYELPWMGEVLALNYNRVFFKQRGIARPPQTWEEVEQVCQKLKGLTHNGVEVAPLAMVFAQGGFFAQNCYIPLLAAYKKGRGIVDERGRPDVASPEAVEVFKTLKRWHQAGYISPNCMVAESIEQDLRVLRAAMYPHWQSRGLWAVKDHGDDVIGIAPTPGAKAAGSLVCTYGCVIPKCSPVVRQAVEFCYETFCTDTYGFQTAVSKGWPDPHRPGVLKGGGKMPATRAMYQRTDLPAGILELGRSLDKGYSYPDPANWGQCAEILAVEFQKYLSGATPTAEEALDSVRRRIAAEVYPDQ
ncbi:MAG TPA: extracellular solute-binding protein [Planctomycetota bacterium]|nr:extracellular solute-binding protein [Planctomycetota bacterium]